MQWNLIITSRAATRSMQVKSSLVICFPEPSPLVVFRDLSVPSFDVPISSLVVHQSESLIVPLESYSFSLRLRVFSRGQCTAELQSILNAE